MAGPSPIMRGAPAAAPDQVTLANWRRAPWSRWGFRNVRRLLPTAEIAPSPHATALARDERPLARLAFAGPDGAETTVGRALADTHTDGMVVLRGGRVAFEWYDGGFDAAGRHVVFSVSKSVIGAVAGVLVDRGLVDPDAPVVRYVPELQGSAWETATVRHALDMTTGVAFQENYEDPAGDVIRFRIAAGWDPAPPGAEPTDLRSYLATLKASGAPHGETFDYVSPNTDVLGWVLERASGLHYADILAQYLWAPLGAAHEANLALDRLGAGRASGGISASLHDVARFGEAMRNRGVANGRSVIPGWWVDDIRTNGDREAWQRGKMTVIFPDAAYRSQWYDLSPTVFAAVGIHGQWIYVDEEAEVVIARVSSQPVAMDLDKDRLWLAGYDAIARHLAR